MRRGDVVVVAMPGDFGKPRPGIVIQSDYMDKSDTVLIVPMTSFTVDATLFRVLIQPDAGNSLRLPSQAMIEKVAPMYRDKVGGPVGRISAGDLAAVDRHLLAVLGLADTEAS